MDSTVIDGTGLVNTTINFQSGGNIQNFMIKGKGEGIINTRCILSYQAIVKNCKLTNADIGFSVVFSSSIVEQCIITNVSIGCLTASIDTQHTKIINSIISISNSTAGVTIFEGGIHSALNNILLGGGNSNEGIQILSGVRTNIIKNNIVTGFNRNIDGYATDTAIVHNNISSYSNQRGFTIGMSTDMHNNIVAYNNVGTVGPTDTNSDYNLYWQNNTHTGVEGLAEHDIVADPMFVNDTIPTYEGSYDFHLQKYSPAIDAGDPNILDVDGSRGDIGVYGGPLGEKYIYQDLAPRPPVNLTAKMDSTHITASWNRNTEADFSFYRIYRDTIPGFIIDSTKLISSQADTFYVQPIPQGVTRLVYKLKAVDRQGNTSGPTEDLIVFITSTAEYPITISNYILYQNYPNPFNPSTKIGYRLKERGYVKLMVYDIKGELLDVLVNKEREAGYYETEFSSQETRLRSGLASGIYIYRIEIIGEGNIPRYSDMKKMLLIK
jgi:hypothetical protein